MRARSRADVVVVGAGAAGAAAALEAHASGASVVVLDQLATFGGTAITSGGGCCVAGSDLQRALGIDDDASRGLRDLLAAGQGQADEAWGRFYFERAARHVFRWLVDRGVDFDEVRPQEDDSVPRWHAPRGAGRGLMETLWSAFVRAGLEQRCHFSTTVTDLTISDGLVTGVRARDAAGSEREFRGTVVMATGGFAGDLESVLEHDMRLRAAERVLAGGGVGAVGSGHRLLAGRGATLTHMGNVWSYAYGTPDYRDAGGTRGLAVRGIDDAIWVNQHGLRFHDESRTGPRTATAALLDQSPATCWAIVDARVGRRLRIADPAFRLDGGASTDLLAELVSASPYCHEADDVETLARRAGIEPAALAATLGAWNGLLRSSMPEDPLTGRGLTGVVPIDQPPYYAVQYFPMARKCLGGVRTTLRCEVIGADGQAIDGLFAAGELAGLAGGHLAGRSALEGIMIGASIFSGRVAGAWAAHAAGAAEPEHLDASRPSGLPGP